MQKTLDDSRDDKAAVYVLNFRYVGGHKDPQLLERQLNSLGWKKVADLTTCYTKSIASDHDNDTDLHQSNVEKFLKEHVSTNKAGAKVSFGISKYIPPNQRPDDYEGIDTLFNEQ